MTPNWSRFVLLPLALSAGTACREGPQEPSDEPIALAAVSVSYFSCGLDAAGAPYCWGGHPNASSGVPDLTPVPVPPPAPGAPLTTISAGGGHVCGMLAAVAYCWGNNSDGALGDGTTTNRTTPVQVPRPGGVPFGLVSAGTYHTCAVALGGVPYCWGKNNYGQLGDGTTITRLSPTPVVLPSGTPFISVTAGENHTCGLTQAHKVWCWGLADAGQLGDGNAPPVPVATPVAVLMPQLAFDSLTIGRAHTCGLTPAGVAWCWGFGHRGRLGNGTVTNRMVPTEVLPPEPATYMALAAGGDHTCALTPQGAAYCWGRGLLGTLGTGDFDDRHRPSPVQMPSGVTFVRLTGGFGHTCAGSSNGGTWCWGYNAGGRLGDGTEEMRLTPVRVVRAP